MLNLYNVLEIRRDATQEEIKSQYRKLARKYHPDTIGNAKEDVKYYNMYLNILTTTRDVLTNEEYRYIYDWYGLEGIKD